MANLAFVAGREDGFDFSAPEYAQLHAVSSATAFQHPLWLRQLYSHLAPSRGAEKIVYIRLPTDKAFAEKIADVYKKHACWTWADDWAWFDEECFMEAPGEYSESAPHRHLFPLNFFTIDGQAQKNWLPLALTVSVATAAVAAATLSE